MILSRQIAKIVRLFLRKFKSIAKTLNLQVAENTIQLSYDNAHHNFDGITGVTIYRSCENEDFKMKPPKSLNGDFLNKLTPIRNRLETVVLDIKNQDFTFRNNHILDGNLNVIYENNITFDKLPIANQFLRKCKKITGSVAYLSNTLPNNYGHWLIDTLPMIRAYQSFIKQSEIDYYYLGDGDTVKDYKLETLNLLGIKKERLINFPCKSDRIFTCVINRPQKRPDIFARNYIKELFLPALSINKDLPKKIFVKRGTVSHRKLINEEEISKFLNKFGFETVDTSCKSVKEQANIFYNADAIISLCGAALTNLLFIRDQTKVIELFPFGYEDPFFYCLASYAKADYYYIIGDKIRVDRKQTPRFYDALVNIDKLGEVCRLAGI